MGIEIYRNENREVRAAFEHVMTNMYLEKIKQGYKTYAICGCSPGTGATAACLELAVLFAEAGWKTVLVDMDFRKEKFCQNLDEMTGADGVSNYALSTISWRDTISETNVKNLSYIGSGTALGDGAVKVLCSGRLEEMMQELRREYDFIIIDMPSLATSLDGKVLCSMADAVVLVVAAGETRKKQLEKAKRQMDELELPIAGVVVSKAQPQLYRQYMDHFDYFEKKEYLRKDVPKTEQSVFWKKSWKLLKKIVGLFCAVCIIFLPCMVAYAEPEATASSIQNQRSPVVLAQRYLVEGEAAPGNEFNVVIQVKNMDAVLAVSQVKTSLQIKTEGVYLTKGDVNQRYQEILRAGETVDYTFCFVASENLEKGWQTSMILECCFTYMSETGTMGSNTTAFSIDLSKRSELEILDVNVPDKVYRYIPTLLDIKYENAGQTPLKNIFMKIKGNIVPSEQSIPLEAVAVGQRINTEKYITFTGSGDQEIEIEVCYEDEDGCIHEIAPLRLSVQVAQEEESPYAAGSESKNRFLDGKAMSTAFTLLTAFVLLVLLRLGIILDRKRAASRERE